MNLKKLEEIAKSKGKVLLIENYNLGSIPLEIEIPEKEVLIESKDGKTQYKARAILKNVPTSKFTENLNGRIYSKKLDEKIIKEGTAEGTSCLADHPEDDGSITRLSGVWHNARVGEKFSYGDLYLIGEYGQLVKEAIEAGSKGVGISRVGFGEFLEDGKTVNPETYELERWGDLVINPSQQVFASYENIESTQKQENKEQDLENKVFDENFTNNCIDKNNNFQENFTNNYTEENLNEVIRMEKFEEKAYKAVIKQEIRTAKANENLMEAIEELKSIDTCAVASIQEMVDSAISELQAKLQAQKEQAEKELKEKSEKFDETVKELEDLKIKYEKATSIIEKLGFDEEVDVEKLNEEKGKLKEAEEKINLLTENTKCMKEDIEKLAEDRKLMEYDLTCLVEDTEKRDYDLNCLVEDRENMEYDIECFLKEQEELTKKNEELENSLREAEDTLDIYTKMLEEHGHTFIEEEEVLTEEMDMAKDVDAENKDKSKASSTPEKGGMDMAKTADEEDKDKSKATSKPDKDGGMNMAKTADKESVQKTEAKKSEQDDDEDKKDDKKKDDKKKDDDEEMDETMLAYKKKKDSVEKSKDNKIEESTKEDEVIPYKFNSKFSYQKEEEIKTEEKTPLKEEVKNPPIKEITKFYEGQVAKYGALEDIKEEILNANTLLEAVEIVETFRNRKDDKIITMEESVNTEDEIIIYKFQK
jgi:hypothetical protein